MLLSKRTRGGRRRRGGLGQMLPAVDFAGPVIMAGGSDISGPTPPTVPPDATSCSTWDFFFDPAAWRTCAALAENAQIQNVAANAAFYYPPPSPAAAVAQAAASQQESSVSADTGNVANFMGADTLLYTPPGQPGYAGLPLWLWAAFSIGGALIVSKALR